MTINEREWKDNLMGKLRLEREEADRSQSPDAILAAKQAEALKVAANCTDAECRRVYGRGSDTKSANDLSLKNPLLYAALKAEVHRRNIYDAPRPGK